MWRIFLITCLVWAMPWQWAQGATSETSESGVPRIALIIGNANYENDPLKSPVNDARAMSYTLKSVGFEVMDYENATRPAMLTAIQNFKRRLEAGGVGLFYFAGHGFQVGNHTMLLPIDADSRQPLSLMTDGIDLETVLASMSSPRRGQVNLVILDTCLNNPFRSGSNILSTLPKQTLVAYGTAPGHLAAEGLQHGLFTAALLKAMVEPGRNFKDVFQSVAAEVRRSSGQAQNPKLSSSLSAAFSLVKAGQHFVPQSVVTMASADLGNATRYRGILPKNSAEQYELTFWESIKDSTFPGDYEAYLQTYPNGRFAALANARLKRLRAAAELKVEKPVERPPVVTPAPKAAPPRVPAHAAPEPTRRAPAPAPKAVPEPTQQTPTVSSAPGKSAIDVAGSEFKDCDMCPVLVKVPRGEFTMGSNANDPSEKPAHHVSISQPFAIGKYEVTTEQWEACVAANACKPISTIASAPKRAPVRDVSWDDAQQYLKWLSKLSDKSYRLPTEAEWEFAARGATTTRYWWGEQMQSGKANCKGCGEPWQSESPRTVGSFAANPFGLHDVNGSVWEWVADCWHSSYRGAPDNGKAWDEKNCQVRVIRGGSWQNDAAYMFSSTRFKYDASVRESQNGFRVVRDLQ